MDAIFEQAPMQNTNKAKVRNPLIIRYSVASSPFITYLRRLSDDWLYKYKPESFLRILP